MTDGTNDELDPKTLRWVARNISPDSTPPLMAHDLLAEADRIELTTPFEVYMIRRESDGYWQYNESQWGPTIDTGDVYWDADEAHAYATRLGGVVMVVDCRMRFEPHSLKQIGEGDSNE